MDIDLNQPVGSGKVPALDFVEGVCECVLSGGTASREELAALLEVEPATPQAATLDRAEETLARRGNGGRGYVYAQIGIDANPCPGNCRFCSFALCNNETRERAEVPFDRILHVSELFADHGVHLTSVMSSAAYRFDRYLELIAQMRRVVGDKMIIMANTRDLDADEAIALAQAGADCVYHAVRIGEGIITDLDEGKRWQTLDNARAAGLDVSTAVGPLYQPLPNSPFIQTKADIVDRMLRVLEYRPFCSGVTGLHAVPGTVMEQVKPWPEGKMRVFGGVFQLAARGQVPYGGYRSVRWVDAGLDPRERGYGSDDERLIRRIARLRYDLAHDGWNVA